MEAQIIINLERYHFSTLRVDRRQKVEVAKAEVFHQDPKVGAKFFHLG